MVDLFPFRGRRKLTCGQPSKSKQKRTQPSKSAKPRGVDPTLPPLSDIHGIFVDLTKKALDNGLPKTLDSLNGHELRIATMCSGTESPVLALQLVSEALEKNGDAPLRLRHVFSAEIVPKKQAYIERNFRPPIIFRDIRELAQEDAYHDGATNVYGAKVQIPGDVDLLVAGFSCVDFSVLNNKGKTLEQKGESRDTLEAILKYAERWTPKIIVLENVYGAPWADCVKRAKKIGYDAEYVRVDSKDYYMPQTRTRGYMVCVHKQQFPGNTSSAMKQWKDLMTAFKRRASAPASAFLLPADDHRVHHFNSQLTSQYRQDGGNRTVNWDACRHRHQKVRRKDRLGNQRPITQWIDNGSCIAFEHAHKMWFSKQVERVWDSIEIRFLRSAKDTDNPATGYDTMFKTSIMELSQNVDRFERETPFGICSCITPSGIFFLTDRGGPLTPYETLALQGLPLDKISFTIETMRELQDLAGNAMTSTVIGAAQLAALIVAAPMLKGRKDSASLDTSSNNTISVPYGEQNLKQVGQHSVDALEDWSYDRLCKDARSSIRLCLCEGQFETTKKEILLCKECQHTVCTNCRSKPVHVYTPSGFCRDLTAHDFELQWKHLFPTSLEFTRPPDISALTTGHLPDQKLWKLYVQRVVESLNEPLKFQKFRRTSNWIVQYESSNAILKLNISHKAEWQLFVKAPDHLSGNHPLRKLLETSVARAQLPRHFGLANDSLWAEEWEWFIPASQSFPMSIQETTPGSHRSWRAQYGLIDYQEETVPESLEVEIPSGSGNTSPVAEQISGTYQHLPACGTACSSLYRRITPTSSPATTEMETDALYLFLDPSRIGPVDEDCFVFSRTHERLEYDEHRDIIASLNPSFRPWNRSSFQARICLAGHWVADTVPPTQLKASTKPLIVTKPSSGPDWGTDLPTDCSQSLAILSMKFHMDESPGKVLRYRFTEASKGEFNKKFAWALGTNTHIPSLKEWRPLAIEETVCNRCVPRLPLIEWLPPPVNKGQKGIPIAQEDSKGAAEYERVMKTRPSILDMAAVIDESGNCHLRIGVNIISLAHRAFALLSTSKNSSSLWWNLTTEYVPPAAPKLQPFRLLDNREDPQHTQPRDFLLKLRSSQRRSLSWMRKQEEGIPFTLQEVAEEVVDSLRWKLEAKAEITADIKGGVIADQVSYGKTITSLALIHAGFCQHQDAPKDDIGLISLKATLVLVPPNLPNQWMEEAIKCLPKKEYASGEILKIKTPKELRALRIEQLQRAKIVIAPYSMLGKDEYVDRLGQLAAVPEAPSADGRPFNAWFDYALRRIPKTNKKLEELGVGAFGDYLKNELDKTLELPSFRAVFPSKRLKGAQYKSLEELKPSSKGSGKTSTSNTTVQRKPTALKEDWTKMQFPVLHQFKFNRLIIDEFHYPRGKEYMGLITLSADKRWILSGTPPLDDFADVKRFAAFLGVSLGIDWDAPGVMTHENSKQLRKEKTKFELFEAFKDKRSPAWHERRHNHAQAFLDTFARQNFAEIGDVKCYEVLRPVNLALDHRAIYEELSSHLRGRAMAMTKPSSAGSDRARRLRQALGDFKTAEEALLHCANHHTSAESSETACSTLIRLRDWELKAYKSEIEKEINEAASLAKRSGDLGSEWHDWSNKHLSNNPDVATDPKAHHELNKMIRAAEKTEQREGGSSKDAAALKKLVRGNLTANARRFTDMRRSLRYVRHVKEVHSLLGNDAPVRCECGDHEVPASGASIVIGCGHIICGDCMEPMLMEERCGVEGCEMEVREHSILSATALRSCADIVPEEDRFGAKLDAVKGLLDQMPDEEQAIIFVQGYAMVSAISKALEVWQIPAYAINRASDTASDDVEAFVGRKPRFKGKQFGRVLVLNMGDESASGM